MSAAEQILAALLEETKAMRAELVALREQSGLKLFTREQAAKALNRDRNYVGQLVRAGLIKVTNDGGRGKISLDEIERLSREGLPSLTKKRGRPRKQARNVGAEIRAVPIRPGKSE